MRFMMIPALLLGAFALASSMTVAPARDDKADWVTIKGQVKMAKAEKRKIEVTTDKTHCEMNGPLNYEDIIVGKNGGVKNVVVWLRPDSTDRKAVFPKDKIHPDLAKAAAKSHTIDQPCCQFIPRIVAMRVGDTLEIKNSASVNHNINMSGDQDTNPEYVFNVNLPPGQAKKIGAGVALQNTPIAFKCDVHPWMAGRVRVFDHPYFAITDAEGKFEIKNAPAGKWRVVYWHEGGFHKGREGILGFPEDVKGSTMELKPIDLELPK
jgi:plastocyanin